MVGAVWGVGVEPRGVGTGGTEVLVSQAAPKANVSSSTEAPLQSNFCLDRIEYTPPLNDPGLSKYSAWLSSK